MILNPLDSHGRHPHPRFYFQITTQTEFKEEDTQGILEVYILSLSPEDDPAHAK